MLKNNLLRTVDAINEFMAHDHSIEQINAATNLLCNSVLTGGRIYIAGNGGSAASAQHIAAEFISKLEQDRNPLPAEALTVDTSILTAIGNDYGFENIFSRQLMAKGSHRDAFIAITTSGMSPNIVKALGVCREKKIPTILLSGGDGGLCSKLADISIIVNSKKTAVIQELHVIIGHTLVGMVEEFYLENTK